MYSSVYCYHSFFIVSFSCNVVLQEGIARIFERACFYNSMIGAVGLICCLNCQIPIPLVSLPEAPSYPNISPFLGIRTFTLPVSPIRKTFSSPFLSTAP